MSARTGSLARVRNSAGTINSITSQSEDLARIAEVNSTAVQQIQGNANQKNVFAARLQDSLSKFKD